MMIHKHQRIDLVPSHALEPDQQLLFDSRIKNQPRYMPNVWASPLYLSAPLR